MKRILIAFTLMLFSSLAQAQTTQCSSFNSNPPIADIRIANSNEHQPGGQHVAETGNGATSNITGACTYSNPSSGNSCIASCSVTFNAGAVPLVNDTQDLVVAGSHVVSTTTANSPSSGATCSATFGMTVNNFSDKTTLVFSQTQPATLTCPAQSLPTPTPTPTPSPTPSGGGGGVPPDPCLNSATVNFQGPVADFTSGGGGGRAPECSPIILDTEGEGFHLTSASGGVSFDISGTGHPIQIAWTDSQYRNAFLALPGPDGLVHNGKDLFGNFTPQPESLHPNGFLALAQYDKPENGGNDDGVIDERDSIFSRLRLWIDENHDGICQPNELYKLPEEGVYSLALGYFESGRTDEFGNRFRYKARVNSGLRRDPRDATRTGDPGRWADDVFFVIK